MRPADPIDRRHIWVVAAALLGVVALNIGTLGSDPWKFEPGTVTASGPLAFLVRLAGGEWDLGLLRSTAMLAGIGVVVLALVLCVARTLPRIVVILACIGVLAALVVPAVTLQVALRDSTAPWFFTNDSTYQLELAGDLLLDGESPYGHDWFGSGLERFYSLDGSVPPGTSERQVALHHFAYFPGSAVLAAMWRSLPAPFDDYRLLVALATLSLFGAALAFPGPLWARLVLGVAAAGNPLAVRAPWFGRPTRRRSRSSCWPSRSCCADGTAGQGPRWAPPS